MYEIDAIKKNVTTAIEKLKQAIAEVNSPEFKQRCSKDYPLIDHYPAAKGHMEAMIWSVLIELSETFGALAQVNRATESVAWMERCAAVCEALGIDESNIAELETAAADSQYRTEIRDIGKRITKLAAEVSENAREQERDNAVALIQAAGFEAVERDDSMFFERVTASGQSNCTQKVAIEWHIRAYSSVAWYSFTLSVDGTETLSGKSGEFCKLLEAVGICARGKSMNNINDHVSIATGEQDLDRLCSKAGCKLYTTVYMDSGCAIYPFCDKHANEAALEHDYAFVQRIR